MKCQFRSLSLDRNVWPSLTTGATDLGSHLICNAPNGGDTLTAWLQIIFGDEDYPYGGSASRVLTEAKLNFSHPRGQRTVLPNNVIKQTSLVARCGAG